MGKIKFPKQEEILNKLDNPKIIHTHDDGDLTIKDKDSILWVITTDGKAFKEVDMDNTVTKAKEAQNPFAVATAQAKKLGYTDFTEGSSGDKKRKEIAEAIKRKSADELPALIKSIVADVVDLIES